MIVGFIVGVICMILDFMYLEFWCGEEDICLLIIVKVYYMYFVLIFFWIMVIIIVVISLFIKLMKDVNVSKINVCMFSLCFFFL